MNLPTRLEQATAEEQEALLCEAWCACQGINVSRDKQPAYYAISGSHLGPRFLTMIDAEAYESAALMLVPEGAMFAFTNASLETGGRDGGAAMVSFDPDAAANPVKGSTPALAIASAAIRARAVGEGADRG